MYRIPKVNLRVNRTIQPVRASQNEPVNISISIKNEGKSLEGLLLEDSVPPLELEAGQSRYVLDIAHDEEIEFSYKMSGTRGVYKFKGFWATTRDSFGLFTNKRFYESKDEIVVLPRAPQLKRFSIRPKITKIYAGNVPSRYGGRGVEFFGVRDYTQGDALRQINWRVSARYPHTLFSNEFEQEKV